MLRKLLDSPWLYFGLAILVLVAGVLSMFRPVAVDAPVGSVEDVIELRERDDLNVVFILIDTLRADRLHVYGYERETSPNMDALANRGIRFAHTESQSSWTKASMASLWTGLYPQRTGVMRFAHAVPDEAVMPAELLKEAGYRTAGIWRNGWVANNFGFGQGFDLYYKPSVNRQAAVQRHNPASHQLSGSDRDSTESAIEFISGTAGERFFLYVHYMDVHQYVYSDTSPVYGAGFSDIYDSAIHWTDQNIGAVVEALKTKGLLANTLIVIASDHGEAFFEHGSEGHARELYGELQEVPLIIVPPVSLEPGVVVEQRVANVDVWPTILDLIGVPPLPEADGRSLVPLIAASAGLGDVPGEFVERPLYAQIDRNWGRQEDEPDPMVSVLKDDYRLLHPILDPDRTELYNKAVDPGEQRDLARREEEVKETLLSEVDALLELPPTAWGEATEVEIDEMKRHQLRALGYVVPGTDRREVRKRQIQDRRMPKEQKRWGDD